MNSIPVLGQTSGEPDDVQRQSLLIDCLRQLVGGPRSLRFPRQLACKGLAELVGRTSARTGWPVEDSQWFFERVYEQSQSVTLQELPDAYRDADAKAVWLYLAIGIQRISKEPVNTRLFIGAALTVLAQLARAGAMSKADAWASVKRAFDDVSANEIAEYRRLAARQPSN